MERVIFMAFLKNGGQGSPISMGITRKVLHLWSCRKLVAEVETEPRFNSQLIFLISFPFTFIMKIRITSRWQEHIKKMGIFLFIKEKEGKTPKRSEM